MESCQLSCNQTLVECPSCGKEVVANKKPNGKMKDFCEECRKKIERLKQTRLKKENTNTSEYGQDHYYTWLNGDDELYC